MVGKKVVYLFGIVFLGSILRLGYLGQKDFWYDEACSLNFACGKLSNIFSHHYIFRSLYFCFLNVWTKLFGFGEFISRLPSAIFGILSIFALYKFAKYFMNEKNALISSFLLAISYFHVVWSQQTRNYSLLVLLVLLSSLYFFKFIRARNNKYFILYIVCSLLMILTSLVSSFVILFQCIYYLIYVKQRLKPKKKMILVSLAVSITLFFLISGFLMKDVIVEDMKGANTVSPSISSFVNIIRTYSSGGGLLSEGGTQFSMSSKIKDFHTWLDLILYMFYLLGIISFIINKKKFSSNIVYLLLWQWGGVVGLSLLALFGFNFFAMKYLIFALPPYYMIVSEGVLSPKVRKFIPVVLGAVIFVNLLSYNEYYGCNDCRSWKNISAYVNDRKKKGDIIVISPLQNLVPFWIYYDGDCKDISKLGNGVNNKGIFINGEWKHRFVDNGISIWGINMGDVESFIKEMKSKKIYLKKENSIWVIVNQGWIGNREYATLLNYFHDNYKLAMEIYHAFGGFIMLKYQKSRDGNIEKEWVY